MTPGHFSNHLLNERSVRMKKRYLSTNAGGLMKKYHDDPLAIDILSAVYREIDRQIRGQERSEKSNGT